MALDTSVKMKFKQILADKLVSRAAPADRATRALWRSPPLPHCLPALPCPGQPAARRAAGPVAITRAAPPAPGHWARTPRLRPAALPCLPARGRSWPLSV